MQVEANTGWEAHARGVKQQKKRKTVFVVEDNTGDLYLLQEVLREAHADCDYIIAQDGYTAISMIEDGTAGTPDAILLDLNLPRRTGVEVLRAIRSSSRLERVPVIILTSSDSDADRLRTGSFGIRRYIVKPLLLDEFFAIGRQLAAIINAPRH